MEMNVSKVFMSLCRYVFRSSERALVLGGFEIKYLLVGDSQISFMKITLPTFPTQYQG